MIVIRDQFIHTGLKIPSEVHVRRVRGEQKVMGRWTHTLHQETDREPSHLTYDEQIFCLKEAVGCMQSECQCKSFQPGRHQIRSCDHCTHGWVTHAVSKSVVCSGQVEIVQSNVVFDISSLILYGTQALPVRMKILLDRLFSVLTHTQVLNIIHTLGWTLRDYIRGYMIQDSTGNVLDNWMIMSPDDELITLQQFLRFGETKSIVELMIEEQRGAGDLQLGSSHTQRDGTMHGFESWSDVFLQPFTSPSVFPASPALSSQHHHPQHLRLNKRTHDKPRTPSKSCLDEQQVCDLNNGGRGWMEVDSSVPDSSSSSSGARERRHGSSSSKSRVSCSACSKTFYDKGTLKIHFNAVHLKIKHLCTIEGCSMMFSSLRSRNRHSANPNPRLHTPQHTTRPSNPRLRTAHPVTRQSKLPLHTTRPSNPRQHGPRHVTHPSNPHQHHPHHVTRTTCSFNHRTFVTRPILNPSPPVLPCHRTSNTACHGNDGRWTGNLTANENSLVRMPKKKPRKSSTPLKFKREGRHDNCHDDDDDDDDDEASVTLFPAESIHGGFHSNTHHHTSNSVSEDERYNTHQTPQHSYHSNGPAEEREDDGWGGHERYLSVLQVKEEVCDPTYDHRGHRHGNL